ncbi:hypothetical protein [Planococcus versutus]|uniref:Peptidase M50 domain-containing protein n=1 Tax=Planococcus versutus TaxID=1302659 RepID=A0A1B1RXZ2_9BACL|nr:hypothetical protein [Planococcus versutus]ANU25810.1 hypothetical protein I858_001800 [Planococcus versutus]
MISFFIFYLIGVPVSILLHEVGHALGITLFTKEKAHVYLGPANDNNEENFRIGRMHFHIKWAFFGFCFVKNRSDFTSFKSIMFSAGGPIISLLLCIAAYLVSADLTHYGTKNFLNGIIYFNLILFIFTSIPITYPNWWKPKPYAGRPSDGYQILTALKSKNNSR